MAEAVAADRGMPHPLETLVALVDRAAVETAPIQETVLLQLSIQVEVAVALEVLIHQALAVQVL
jgi:hypothetical protein